KLSSRSTSRLTSPSRRPLMDRVAHNIVYYRIYPRPVKRLRLGLRAERRSWPRGGETELTYVITEPCIGVKDASCVEVCPVDCIHTDDEAQQYFIDPEECIDCAACVELCPV